jgi:hypothetical protein
MRKDNIFIPLDKYSENIKYSEKEDAALLLNHILLSLGRQELIDKRYFYNECSNLKPIFPQITTDGIVVGPSPLGINLYLWVHGYPNLPLNHFLNPNLVLRKNDALAISLDKV